MDQQKCSSIAPSSAQPPCRFCHLSQGSSGNARMRPTVVMRSILGLVWVIVSTIVGGVITLLVACFWRPALHSVGRCWARLLLRVFGIRTVVEGLENIPAKQCVFIANHQSHLDIPVLLSVIPRNLVFIAKKELFYIPFFGWGISAMGHIKIDRSSPRKARCSFDRAIRKLRETNVSLTIFPEGTRSPDGRVGEFKRGTFTLAIEAGLMVVPLAISGTGKALRKKALLVRPATVHIRIGQAVDAAQYCGSVHGKEALVTAVRTAIISLFDGVESIDCAL